jgi:molybdenum cofactor cytidylyltransferase
MRTLGLIPAAGKSRRMGRPKLSLTCGDSTVIECVLAAVRTAGIEEVLVVVAPDAEDLARLAESAGAHVLRLPSDTPDMRATCEHGLAWLEERYHPADDDGWLLLPADHPTVRPGVVCAILDAAPGRSIVVPVHESKRGHPTWLRWSHVAAIRALPPDQGLNALIRANAAQTFELDWPSDAILRDLDTPQDYERLVKDLTT